MNATRTVADVRTARATLFTLTGKHPWQISIDLHDTVVDALSTETPYNIDRAMARLDRAIFDAEVANSRR